MQLVHDRLIGKGPQRVNTQEGGLSQGLGEMIRVLVLLRGTAAEGTDPFDTYGCWVICVDQDILRRLKPCWHIQQGIWC